MSGTFIDKMKHDWSFWSIGRPQRASAGGWIDHVLNRANAQSPIFETPEDFEAFERVLAEAVERTGIRLLAYCVPGNHWHLVVCAMSPCSPPRVTRRREPLSRSIFQTFGNNRRIAVDIIFVGDSMFLYYFDGRLKSGGQAP